MSAHEDEAESAAADGGPRAYVSKDRWHYYSPEHLDKVERIHDAFFITPAHGGIGRDQFGDETHAMLVDRIMRSALHYVPQYRGQRLPYEPRQGPVRKTDAQQREEAFEAELESLQEKYWVDLGGDYWINARACCACGEPSVPQASRCLNCSDD